ncbi:MAG TPA: glycosyltransferase family 2 protein [Sulfurospirillum arcachonense]|nr:glycosyltransferase family 2 protein [Sulfurospirillum arcachonense]
MIYIVIPTYNSPYIEEVVNNVTRFSYKVIVVDDGSNIPIKLKNTNIEIIRHDINLGKGAAILTGAKRVKELGGKFFVTMDADKQHIASEIKKLIDAYKDGTIVIGNRNFNTETVPQSSKFGRKFSNFWVKIETFLSLGDTQSGFRIYPISILDLPLKKKRFDFEIEVLALHVYNGGKIVDVDVECYYPPTEERVSHFDKLYDNIRLSITHTRLIFQRYLLLRGWLWK